MLLLLHTMVGNGVYPSALQAGEYTAIFSIISFYK